MHKRELVAILAALCYRDNHESAVRAAVNILKEVEKTIPDELEEAETERNIAALRNRISGTL